MTKSSDPIIVILAEREGRGRYEARVGGRVVIKPSRTPFLDAARILLAEGYGRKTKIIMRRTHDGIDCLTSTVGKAAKLDVYEADERNGVRFKPWRRSRCPQPPIDLIQPAVPQRRPVGNKRPTKVAA